MFYTIYKITNNLNGKYYIGKHQTKDLNDGYFGSGKLIKRAIQKYGIDNFTKEILFVFDTEAEMNAKEKELVELNESSYNLCPGGKGGFGYINNTTEIKTKSGKTRIKNNPELLKSMWNNYDKWFNKLSSEEKIIWKQNISQSLIGDKNPKGFLNKTHTEETKQKMSQSSKGKVPWNKGKSWKDWHPKAK